MELGNRPSGVAKGGHGHPGVCKVTETVMNPLHLKPAFTRDYNVFITFMDQSRVREFTHRGGHGHLWPPLTPPSRVAKNTPRMASPTAHRKAPSMTQQALIPETASTPPHAQAEGPLPRLQPLRLDPPQRMARSRRTVLPPVQGPDPGRTRPGPGRHPGRRHRHTPQPSRRSPPPAGRHSHLHPHLPRPARHQAHPATGRQHRPATRRQPQDRRTPRPPMPTTPTAPRGLYDPPGRPAANRHRPRHTPTLLRKESQQ